MEKKTSLEFALYRLDRAKQEQATAELLYKENKLLAANNRAYYSIFYAIRETTALQIETAKELIKLVEKFLNNLQNK